jgi:hypothetical protein
MTKLDDMLHDAIMTSVKFEIAAQVQRIVAETVQPIIKDRQKELERLAVMTVAELLNELGEVDKG